MAAAEIKGGSSIDEEKWTDLSHALKVESGQHAEEKKINGITSRSSVQPLYFVQNCD